MSLPVFLFCVAGASLAIAGAVRGFNWLMRVIGLDDDSWPQGPR